jgi:hypothetical protein
MHEDFSEQKPRSILLEQYWDYFYTDNFSNAIDISLKLYDSSETDFDRDDARELKAKILLKQGLYLDAYDLIKDRKSFSPFRLFLEFLLEGNLRPVLGRFKNDVSSHVYKAFSSMLSKVYWGADYLKSNEHYEDPDLLLEKAFDELIAEGKIDFAILTLAKSVEISLQEAHLSKDLISLVSLEQIDNLIKFSEQAKYDSTKARLFLLKALLTKNREFAEDAEILFGKDKNRNGLAEVYLFYANEFGEEEYFSKAINLYNQVGNNSAFSLINSIILLLSTMPSVLMICLTILS